MGCIVEFGKEGGLGTGAVDVYEAARQHTYIHKKEIKEPRELPLPSERKDPPRLSPAYQAISSSIIIAVVVQATHEKPKVPNANTFYTPSSDARRSPSQTSLAPEQKCHHDLRSGRSARVSREKSLAAVAARHPEPVRC